MIAASAQRTPRAVTQDLSALLFTPDAAWRVSPSPHTSQEIVLGTHPVHGRVLEVRGMGAKRITPHEPWLALLAVPALPSLTSFWACHAQLLERYHRGEGAQGLSSSFFKGLLSEGFEPRALDNIVSGEVCVDLVSASTLEISRAALSHKGVVRATRLDMRDVCIDGAQLDIRSSGGTWDAVRGAGKRTRLSGDVGATVFSKSCKFSECLFEADLRAARFEMSVSENFKGCLVSIGMVPKDFHGRVKAVSDEDFKLRERGFASSTYEQIPPLHGNQIKDRTQ